MKIGIIAPSPVPFQMGGAERLWTNLRRYINESNSASAEVVKLPVSESTFWSTVEGYRQFRDLDVSGFDLVITGKNPAWMIEHPNHTLYMVHPCRGLYEFYEGPVGLTDQESAERPIARLWDALDKHKGDSGFANELLDTLHEFAQSANMRDAVSWPGPFARRAIRFLDEIALSPKRIARYSAISRTVAKRPDYFPTGVSVSVAYPPAACSGSVRATRDEPTVGAKTTQRDDASPNKRFFFTASRLDKNKRIGLIIEAMSTLSGNFELLIAGEGDEFAALRAQAQGDPRIKLLGRVTETELSRLYRNCLAVIFVPFNEDYGLVAIEAFANAKPLITCDDSGGAAELNQHDRTGLTVAPTAASIATSMQSLFADESKRCRLGALAGLAAADANWPKVLNAVTGKISPAFGKRGAPRLVVTLCWAFFPAISGGQVRVYHLYKNLAKWFDITVVCLVPNAETYRDTEVAPGLREIRVPKSRSHHERDKLAEHDLGVPVYDITGGLYISETPAYREVLTRECEHAYAVVACHPYFAPLLRNIFTGPLWYEAQDVEYDMKSQLLPAASRWTKPFLEFTRAAEKLACDESEHIWVCSADDAQRLSSLYPSAAKKTLLVPNGTNVASFHFQTVNQRIERRRIHLGSQSKKYALFLGSGHGPNIEAVRAIMRVAPETPNVVYWIVGSVSYAFDPHMKPANVWYLGELSETERRIVMELAVVALNPLTSGSGTSIKMFDYMACGLPVISSVVGARGLNLTDGIHYYSCEPDNLGAFLNKFDPLNPSVNTVANNARKHVEIHGDWTNIIRNLMSEQFALDDSGVTPPPFLAH